MFRGGWEVVGRQWQRGLYAATILFFLVSSNAGAEDISGTWTGVMVKDNRQGPMTLIIQRQGQNYLAEYQGFPTFSGPLVNVKSGPGKEPGITTFTAVSKAVPLSGGNEARLRFYLTKKPSLPQLGGLIRLDADTGKDQDFSVVLERPPCCYEGCVLREGCR